MVCVCGANYGDLHAPGCQVVERLVSEIRSGRVQINYVLDASGDELTSIVKTTQMTDGGWCACHGLNPDGTVPGHQPEIHDWK